MFSTYAKTNYANCATKAMRALFRAHLGRSYLLQLAVLIQSLFTTFEPIRKIMRSIFGLLKESLKNSPTHEDKLVNRTIWHLNVWNSLHHSTPATSSDYLPTFVNFFGNYENAFKHFSAATMKFIAFHSSPENISTRNVNAQKNILIYKCSSRRRR